MWPWWFTANRCNNIREKANIFFLKFDTRSKLLKLLDEMTRRDFAQTRYSIKIAEITRRLDEMTGRSFAETWYSVKIAEITRRFFLVVESLRQGFCSLQLIIKMPPSRIVGIFGALVLFFGAEVESFNDSANFLRYDCFVASIDSFHLIRSTSSVTLFSSW